MTTGLICKDYKINKHNSTVDGYPSREFDWLKFCWDGSDVYRDKFQNFGRRAPLPWVDDGFIAPNCQYLHVPYDWAKMCTIYRVRPNDSMYAGEIYRRHLIKRQEAIQKADGWYWRLFFEDKRVEP